jgi:hypothetical protein
MAPHHGAFANLERREPMSGRDPRIIGRGM